MLLALRILALYFCTVTGCFWLVQRFIAPIRLRIALMLALAPLLLTGKAVMTGGVYAPIDIAFGGYPLESKRGEMGIIDTRTPLLADVVNSYIPARKALRDAAKNGRLPLWNRFSAAGEPLLAFQYPGALHPLAWIAFALPLAQGWTFEMSVRLFLAVLCAYLFFRELEIEEPTSVLGGLGWALSDHFVFFLGYSVAASLIPFPLLLLGLRRLARSPGRNAVGIAVAALVLMILGGHPEVLLHCVVAGGLFFLFELWTAPKGNVVRALALSVLVAFLSLGLTAMMLLPFAEIVPYTETHAVRSSVLAVSRRSVDLDESLKRSARNIWPYVYGVSGRSDTAHGYGLPAGYAGSVFFPLALLGFSSRRREKWYFLGCLLLGGGLWARLAGLSDLFGRLPLLRIAVNDYFVFLAAFGVVGLGVLGTESLRQPRRRTVGAWLALLCLGLILAGSVRVRPHLMNLGMSAQYATYRLLLQLLPLAALVIWLFWPRRRVAGFAITAGIVLIAAAQRCFEAGEVYPTIASKAFYPPLALLSAIPRNVPYRMVAVGYTLVPNSSALYELEDVRGYEAMVLLRFAETFPLWCVKQPAWFNRVDDPARPFLSFLNVRYAITGLAYPVPPRWKILAQDGSGRLLENPDVVERVFVPEFIAYIAGSAHQVELLQQIKDFRRFGLVERGAQPAMDSAAWVTNGRASARVREYTAQEILVEIEAKDRAVVATSIPVWSGWRVSVDGRETTTTPYNLASLSFVVPPGKHTARLAYLPRGFTDGLVLSGLTLLVCVVMIGAPHLRRTRGDVPARASD